MNSTSKSDGQLDIGVDFDIEEQFDAPPEELDPAFLNVAKLGIIVGHFYDGLEQKAAAGEDVVELFGQEYIDALGAGVHACQSLLDRDDVEAVKRDLGGTLDDETVRDLDDTLSPLADHFDLECELPAADGEVR